MAEIVSRSLDEAWLAAVQMACGSRAREISPLAITFDVAKNYESQSADFRAALDQLLQNTDRATVETVASTIFPRSLWNPSGNRQDLFRRYLKILPTLKSFFHNRRGLYFERLISYPSTGKAGVDNQLDHIIETFARGNHRRSALQAAVFYPPKDLNHSRQQGFPCLQQVAFAHRPSGRALTITGFYAMQYLFERAYGNYLGLARLGEFMAHEMGLKLERVVCFSAVAKLEVPMNEVEPLLSKFWPQHRNGTVRLSK
jgi:hypothetical protein